MVERIIDASEVKPNFSDVKDVWKKMLSPFYENENTLSAKFVKKVNCPHCDENSPYNAFKLNGFVHQSCSKCQCLYVSPRLKDEQLSKLYSDDYYSEMFTNSMLPYFDKRKAMIGQNKYVQIIEQRGDDSVGRVLDIGSGLGEVLDVFHDGGWDCEAVEVNPVAVNSLVKRKIKVFSDVFDNYVEGEQFDVIMAWGVIEHVIDPKAFLSKVYRLLKPGGIFVSEVPHGNCLLAEYCRRTAKDPERILQGEQHIILYSIDAYKELHLNTGLDMLHIQTNGLDMSTIVNISGESMSAEVIADIQQGVDKAMNGDLLRGFWQKSGEL